MTPSEIRVSAPERLFLVPRATSETPESALVVPELRGEISYFLCLVDAGSIEEHAVVLVEGEEPSVREVVRRALNLRRPRKVSFWRSERDRWSALDAASRASVAAGLVCAREFAGVEPHGEAAIEREGLMSVVTFR